MMMSERSATQSSMLVRFVRGRGRRLPLVGDLGEGLVGAVLAQDELVEPRRPAVEDAEAVLAPLDLK